MRAMVASSRRIRGRYVRQGFICHGTVEQEEAVVARRRSLRSECGLDFCAGDTCIDGMYGLQPAILQSD